MGAGANLLDNWYFADPINQRGKSTYNLRDSYGIDRWNGARLDCVLTSDGISVSKQDGTSYSNGYIQQKMELSRLLDGATYTFSVVVGEVLYSGSFVADATHSSVINGDWGWADFEYNMNNTHRITIRFTGSATLQAAKLELGDHQTLAHQDVSGNWVLNDPPPDKALELAKCQRYYQRYDKDGFCGIARFSNYVSGSGATIFIPTPVTMRANPAVSISGQFDTYTAEESIETNMTYSGSGVLSDNGITVMSVPVSDEFETAMGLFRPYDGGLIELSAEL